MICRHAIERRHRHPLTNPSVQVSAVAGIVAAEGVNY
jgi:hypothetical protein